jgi:hypothetical protein
MAQRKPKPDAQYKAEPEKRKGIPEYGVTPLGKPEKSTNFQSTNYAVPAKVIFNLPVREIPRIPAGQPGNVNVWDVKKKAKEAGAEVQRRRPPSKQPGYVRPSRTDTVGLATRVPPELRDAFKKVAAQEGLQSRQLAMAVLRYAVAHQQTGEKPVNVDVREAIDQYRKAERAAAREAALRLAASLL